MFTIYSLTDPRNNAVRYIGLTNNMYARLKQHMSFDGGNAVKDAWLQDLQEAGYIVVMQPLEQVELLAQAFKREAYWIRYYLDLAAPLTNILGVPASGRNNDRDMGIEVAKSEAVIYPVEANCKSCGMPVPQVPGRRKREFCNPTCRQRYHRLQQRSQTTEAIPEGDTASLALVTELEQQLETARSRSAELEDYNTRLKSLLSIEQQRAKDQEKEISRLKALLDTERRYHDNQPRNFRGWLRKQPSSDLIKRLLSLGDRLPLKGNRAYYLAMVRALQGPESDVPEFEDLWRSMLLSQE